MTPFCPFQITMVKDNLKASFAQHVNEINRTKSPTDKTLAGPTKALLFITLLLIGLSV